MEGTSRGIKPPKWGNRLFVLGAHRSSGHCVVLPEDETQAMSVILQYFWVTNHFENLGKARESSLKNAWIYMHQFHIELEGVPGFLKSIHGPQVKRRWTEKSFKGFPFYESLGWMFYPSEDQTQTHAGYTLRWDESHVPSCPTIFPPNFLPHCSKTTLSAVLFACHTITGPSQLVFQWGHALKRQK